ncbi:MAG: RsiV family protein [Monoglobales bacterium]
MPSEAHCQADRGINAEFFEKILDRSVTILLDKNNSIQNAVSIVDNYTLSRFNYYIENDNIYLCYPIYELGPGAMGQIVVCCPIII